MAKKQTKTAITTGKTVQANGNRTSEELRSALREHDIETSADSQLKAIGAIYRVATHEPEVNLRTLLSAIGRVQNLQSLALRYQTAKQKNAFFLSA
jgi:hypothetical protein